MLQVWPSASFTAPSSAILLLGFRWPSTQATSDQDWSTPVALWGRHGLLSTPSSMRKAGAFFKVPGSLETREVQPRNQFITAATGGGHTECPSPALKTPRPPAGSHMLKNPQQLPSGLSTPQKWGVTQPPPACSHPTRKDAVLHAPGWLGENSLLFWKS